MPGCACCARPQGGRAPVQTRASLSGRSQAVAEMELRVTELIDCEDGSGSALTDGSRGWGNNLPVVIVPGFCSSGLKVVRSDENPEWEDERVRGCCHCSPWDPTSEHCRCVAQIWFSLQKLSASKAAIGATKRRSTMSSSAAQLVPASPIAPRLYHCLLGRVESLDHGVDAADCDRTPCRQSGSDGCASIVPVACSHHTLTLRVDLATDANGRSDPYVRVRLLSAEGEALDM